MFPSRMNFIWSRDPQEAYQEPYEYNAQKQFLRESKLILNELFNHLMKTNRCFTRDDRSVEKAIWMLHVDACDTLRDCEEFLKKGRHRIVIRLFRDVIEPIDLSIYFMAKTPASLRNLEKWFDDSIISHSTYRDWIDTQKPGFKDIIVKEYKSMSKFTHRSYKALAHSYILGINDILAYEGDYKSSDLPHPISLCCALFAHYIKTFSLNLVLCSLISINELENIYEAKIGKEPVKRRFSTPKDIYERMLKSRS
jgi:hypothetical protein